MRSPMFGDLVNELVHDICADGAFSRGFCRDRGAGRQAEKREQTHWTRFRFAGVSLNGLKKVQVQVVRDSATMQGL